MKNLLYFIFSVLLVTGCQTHKYDILIKNGTIYDGSGLASFKGDLAINADTIAAFGNLENARGESCRNGSLCYYATMGSGRRPHLQNLISIRREFP